mmetsp:Transcript_34305/g.94521  ORF Transcript_34305/g.94521 Transcript_34305/m.94521 type:complete len:313 (+) Transcript_34305:129-1067(+)
MDDYVQLRKLGQGSFGTALLVHFKADAARLHVIKVVEISKLSKKDEENALEEVRLLASFDHPNIVRYLDSFAVLGKLHIVMDYADCGDLRTLLKEYKSQARTLGEEQLLDYFKQLSAAIHYMHKRKVLHRDLKPENILLSNREPNAPIKVADFGLARVVSNKDMMKTACGTPGYVAPEVLQNKGYTGGAIDMWSTGVILYILLCGFPPFYEEELPALFEQIMKARYDFPSPWWDNISSDAKALVQGLLTIEPKKRLTAAQVMKHPWITGGATDQALTGAKDQLRKYNATRKLKKAAQGIMAGARLAKLTAAS